MQTLKHQKNNLLEQKRKASDDAKAHDKQLATVLRQARIASSKIQETQISIAALEQELLELQLRNAELEKQVSDETKRQDALQALQAELSSGCKEQQRLQSELDAVLARNKAISHELGEQERREQLALCRLESVTRLADNHEASAKHIIEKASHSLVDLAETLRNRSAAPLRIREPGSGPNQH